MDTLLNAVLSSCVYIILIERAFLKWKFKKRNNKKKRIIYFLKNDTYLKYFEKLVG